LAAGASETAGSALDGAPHSQSSVAFYEPEKHRCLRAGATGHDHRGARVDCACVSRTASVVDVRVVFVTASPSATAL
jgi:hypothetical protein